MKLASNEFYVLKITDKPDAYYGDANFSLRGAKLYKNFNIAQEKTEEAQRYYGLSVKIVILSMSVRDLD